MQSRHKCVVFGLYMRCALGCENRKRLFFSGGLSIFFGASRIFWRFISSLIMVYITIYIYMYYVVYVTWFDSLTFAFPLWSSFGITPKHNTTNQHKPTNKTNSSNHTFVSVFVLCIFTFIIGNKHKVQKTKSTFFFVTKE